MKCACDKHDKNEMQWTSPYILRLEKEEKNWAASNKESVGQKKSRRMHSEKCVAWNMTIHWVWVGMRSPAMWQW